MAHHHLIDRRAFIGAAAGLAVGSRVSVAQDESTWSIVRSQIFGDRPIVDTATFLSLVAPVRAEDAALVPIDIHIAMATDDLRTVKAMTLVVDENPSPLVAKFDLGGGTRGFDLSIRIRVNSYSFVRVVSETSDGLLHMTKSFVKAAGGCSAPAGKDPEQAKAEMGKMRFRVFTGTGRDEAQLQIRHPNYSGMQMDQVTRLYTPALFIESLDVRQGDKPLFAMQGGISLSEDPTFRFSYRPNGDPVLIDAKDSQGALFEKTFPANGNA